MRDLIERHGGEVLDEIYVPMQPPEEELDRLVARALHRSQNRLLNKVAKLKETLRSRREIERATRILMEVKGSSEDSAYQLIRQQATAQRLAMGVVARSIIIPHRVFDRSVEDNTRIAREPRSSVLRLPISKSP